MPACHAAAVHRLQLPTPWGSLLLVGGSRAGEGTVLLLPQLRLALDAGRPARALVPATTVCVTHGHLDHILGVPAWASQRQLQGMPPGRLVVPAPQGKAFAGLLERFAALEGGGGYGVEILEAYDGFTLPLRPAFELVFFTTTHWVPTLGCCLWWTRQRLRPDLAGLPGEELAHRRAAGETITEEVRLPLLAYLGDTDPRVFDRHPWLTSVEVLITECTFLRPKDRERAARFGHTHLDDLAARAATLHNRHLVLTHLSRRHRLAAGSREIRRRLATFSGQLHLLNSEWE